jgi:hypothetical protein
MQRDTQFTFKTFPVSYRSFGIFFFSKEGQDAHFQKRCSWIWQHVFWCTCTNIPYESHPFPIFQLTLTFLPWWWWQQFLPNLATSTLNWRLHIPRTVIFIISWFRLLPQGKWHLRCVGILCNVEFYFLTDFSGQPIGPTYKRQGGTDRLSRNVCKNLPFYAA